MLADIRLVVVTGLSGAGKTQAIKSLEDLGFFCVDNLPPALIGTMVDLCRQSRGKVNLLALGIDIRGGEFFASAIQALDRLQEDEVPCQILFFEASDEVLVRRFKETRRRHPLAESGGTLDGLKRERQLLEGLRARAHHVLDTTHLSAAQLRKEVVRVVAREEQPGLSVTVVSFGFKYGLPMDADLVLDVRFLPNPHYDESLRALTGEHPAIQDYLNRWPVTKRFYHRLTDLVGFLLPHYATEGKRHLTIGLGCTGGQHRSVALAIWLVEWLRNHGYTATGHHRDVGRGGVADGE